MCQPISEPENQDFDNTDDDYLQHIQYLAALTTYQDDLPKWDTLDDEWTDPFAKDGGEAEEELELEAEEELDTEEEAAIEK